MVIKPDNQKLIFWNYLFSLVFIVDIFYMTSVVFEYRDDSLDSNNMIFLNLFEVFFLIEMCLHFLRAYHNDSGLVQDPATIANSYLKTYFFLDLLAMFPFYTFYDSLRFIRLLRISRLKYSINLLLQAIESFLLYLEKCRKKTRANFEKLL